MMNGDPLFGTSDSDTVPATISALSSRMVHISHVNFNHLLCLQSPLRILKQLMHSLQI